MCADDWLDSRDVGFLVLDSDVEGGRTSWQHCATLIPRVWSESGVNCSGLADSLVAGMVVTVLLNGNSRTPIRLPLVVKAPAMSEEVAALIGRLACAAFPFPLAARRHNTFVDYEGMSAVALPDEALAASVADLTDEEMDDLLCWLFSLGMRRCLAAVLTATGRLAGWNESTEARARVLQTEQNWELVFNRSGLGMQRLVHGTRQQTGSFT